MAVFLLLWLIGVVYFVSTLMSRTSEKETALQRQVEREKQEVRRLEQENDGLRNLVVEMQGPNSIGDQILASNFKKSSMERVGISILIFLHLKYRVFVSNRD